MITYKNINEATIGVFLNEKEVGHIRYLAFDCKWQYFPKGSKIGGDKFCSLSAVKKSLEE